MIAPGFVDRPRRSDCTAGQMDGEAGWWTTSGNIGLPPLARAMGVGRQQYEMIKGYNVRSEKIEKETMRYLRVMWNSRQRHERWRECGLE